MHKENYSMCTDQSAREQELRDFIAWTKDNPKDWNRICNMDSYEITAEYISDLVERLYAQGFLTVIYMFMHTNWAIREVEWAISATIKESVMDVSQSVLIERILQNLKATIKTSPKTCE